MEARNGNTLGLGTGYWIVIVLAAFVCGAVGCGATKPQETRGPEIAGILFQEDQFFRLIEYGMKAKADELDVALLMSNSFGSLDKEISLVDTYIARHVDAIAISPLSRTASAPALRRAHDRGIPIIAYNSTIDADFTYSNITSDEVSLGGETGKAARRYVAERLGGEAKVIMIEFMSLLPESSGKRVQGFKDEITALPGVEIVAEQDAWLAPDATRAVESLLTAHPDASIVWSANEGGTVGSVTAVRNAGRVGAVTVFGTDMSEQMADFLLAEDGVLHAVTGQKPFEIGAMAVEAAVKALRGQPVEKDVLLPGILFTRERPDEVRAYKAYLERLTEQD